MVSLIHNIQQYPEKLHIIRFQYIYLLNGRILPRENSTVRKLKLVSFTLNITLDWLID